jgi:hypothetical protein
LTSPRWTISANISAVKNLRHRANLEPHGAVQRTRIVFAELPVSDNAAARRPNDPDDDSEALALHIDTLAKDTANIGI